MTREQTSAPVQVDREFVSRSFPLETDRIHDFIRTAPGPRMYWKEPERPPIVSSGAAAWITVDSTSGDGRFDTVRTRARTLFENLHRETGEAPHRSRPILVGGFSFHPRDGDHDNWKGFPSARFLLPRIQWTPGDGGVWVTLNEVPERMEPLTRYVHNHLLNESVTAGTSRKSDTHPRIEQHRQRPERDRWIQQVREALDAIGTSALRKVVLAQSMEIQFDRSLTVPFLYDRLREDSDPTFQYMIESPTRSDCLFMGSSPELLVELDRRKLRTESLAGTVEAGSNDEEKQTNASRLIDSPKDRKEHAFVVSAIQDHLQPLVDSIEIGQRTVRSLNSVQHLCTPVTAQLREPHHVLSLVEALHPTPAVGGVPTNRALEFLRQHEPFPRGWYAGPVGWFDGRGRGRFTVGIRSALVHDRVAHLYAGSGIVQHSDPGSEWEEVQWKYKALMRLLQNS